MKTLSALGVLLLLATISLHATIVLLKNGEFFVGDIIAYGAASITLENRYGTFRLQKTAIKEILRTGSPEEDVLILAARGIRFKPDMVRLNYRNRQPAGRIPLDQVQSTNKQALANLTNTNPAKPATNTITAIRLTNSVSPARVTNHTVKKQSTNAAPTSGRMTVKTDHPDRRLLLTCGYASTVGGLETAIPRGFAVSAGFEDTLAGLVGLKNAPRYLSLRIDLTGMYSAGNAKATGGFGILPGAVYRIPLVGQSGFLTISGQLGFAMFWINNRNQDYTAVSTTLAGGLGMGYRHVFGSSVIELGIRYHHIFDTAISLQRIGLEAGYGFKL